MAIKKILILIFFIFTLSSCNKEPEYSKMISECLEQSRKDYLSSGNIKFFENPVRKCLDEKFDGIRINDLIFKNKEGNLINVNDIQKPVYIQTFSRRIGQCQRELESLNKLVEKYKEKVEFILLINRDYELSRLCQSRLYRVKSPEECEPNKYNENINIVYFRDEDLINLKDGYGEMIYGIRNTQYPTCYYLNKDKTVFKITTIEDIMIESNKVYSKNESLNDKELSEESFANRVPEIFEKFVNNN